MKYKNEIINGILLLGIIALFIFLGYIAFENTEKCIQLGGDCFT